MEDNAAKVLVGLGPLWRRKNDLATYNGDAMAEPYPQILSDSWALAPEVLRRVHTVGRAKGYVQVEHGSHMLCPLIARIGGFPPASPSVPVELTVIECGDWYAWRRRIGTANIVTFQRERDGLLVERYRGFECAFQLRLEKNMLVHNQVGAALAMGRFRIPLPRWLAPRIIARAHAVENSVVFCVQVQAPLVGTILVYDGSVTPQTLP